MPEPTSPPSSAAGSGDAPNELRLFVYGTLLSGERDHGLLAGATFVGPVRTVPEFALVDLVVYPALVAPGRVAIVGELYLVSKKHRFTLDVKKECPVLFHRRTVRLEDGEAEAYAMRDEQARGKRRIANGDWKNRFAPKTYAYGRVSPSPLARGARRRTP
jgi:gamma-glutamylaminecyclotransferase